MVSIIQIWKAIVFMKLIQKNSKHDESKLQKSVSHKILLKKNWLIWCKCNSFLFSFLEPPLICHQKVHQILVDGLWESILVLIKASTSFILYFIPVMLTYMFDATIHICVSKKNSSKRSLWWSHIYINPTQFDQ